MRARDLPNVVGSALTLVSTLFPWIRVSHGLGYAPTPVPANDMVPILLLVVAGGILSLLSRYGGVLALAGISISVANPFAFSSTVNNGASLPLGYEVSFVYELGFWLAWAGATISLLGGSWTLPFGFPRTAERRKSLAMGIFPIGVVATAFGLLFGLILGLPGIVLIGTSLIILVPQDRLQMFGRLRKLIGNIRSPQREA